ncbi:MAG TPA: glycoside hydrolase family 6 protein [Anaerolineales bacterium]|nr:glycoside hydrolase family 6 protein [Anaerolineales bacterium]
MTNQRKLIYILIASTLLMVLMAPASALAQPQSTLDPNTQFYVAKPIDGARQQVAALTSSGNQADANLIREMIETPQSVWFNGGTPQKVQQDVKNTVQRAAGKGQVPVLVAYNIPFRDCSQFSAGGATSVAEYEAWIDSFAAGIGSGKAVVILEPDGLGIIPWYQPFGTKPLEWCQPAEADAATAATDRFAMLNYAVDALKAHPNTSVYLDGTHSAWLAVGDAADRLVLAGVSRADGFFLNVSNYQYSTNLVYYGTWISKCIAMINPANRPSFDTDCPNQYWNGGPHPARIADLLGEWTGVALSNYGVWSDTTDTPNLNTSGINLRYSSVTGITRFVIDTSRNGQGPWQPPSYPDPQDWCNPPERGLGLQPTANTNVLLLDAYLWVKIPGASDGECTRGLGPAGETIDPEWGLIDPAAGAWFPEMALDLVHNANPPLP